MIDSSQVIDQFTKKCFCLQKGYQHMPLNCLDIRNDYFKQVWAICIYCHLIVLIIIIGIYYLPTLIQKMKYIHQIQYEKSLIHYIFWFILLISQLILILDAANLTNYVNTNHFINKYIFNGQYNELTGNWYSTIGIILMLIPLGTIFIIIPCYYFILYKYTNYKLLKFYQLERNQSQQEQNLKKNQEEEKKNLKNFKKKKKKSKKYIKLAKY